MRRTRAEVVLVEQLRDEFPPAAHTDLVKDGLKVTLNSVERDAQLLQDFGGGQALQHQLGDLARARRQLVRLPWRSTPRLLWRGRPLPFRDGVQQRAHAVAEKIGCTS